MPLSLCAETFLPAHRPEGAPAPRPKSPEPISVMSPPLRLPQMGAPALAPPAHAEHFPADQVAFGDCRHAEGHGGDGLGRGLLSPPRDVRVSGRQRAPRRTGVGVD
jgi:hypothetical protein